MTMTARHTRIRIPIGDDAAVSAVIAQPPDTQQAAGITVVLAHGAGNDMEAPFLSAVHAGLAEQGFVSVKFNFPYRERGQRAPDRAPVLEACYRRVLAMVHADPRTAQPRVVIGGKSLGGRMASHLAAQGVPVAGLLLLGYPLHPAGAPERRRDGHLPAIHVPMLFVAGTRDPLCSLDRLRATLARLPAPVTLHVIDGGDHSFEVPRRQARSRIDVWDDIVRASAAWLRALPNP